MQDVINEAIKVIEKSVVETLGPNLKTLHSIHQIELKLASVAVLMEQSVQGMQKRGGFREVDRVALTALDQYSDQLIAQRRMIAPDGEYPEGVPLLTAEMLNGA